MQHNQRKQRKLAKKRKAERLERTKRTARLAVAVEPYTGNKYKTIELVGWILDAETAINEIFVMTKRTLTDHQVTAALTDMVLRIRQSQSPGLEGPAAVHAKESHLDELVIWNIFAHWGRRYSEGAPQPSRDSLIGVLRTIMGSVEVWKSSAPDSRGYLKYVEKFLDESFGVRTREVPEDEVPQWLADENEFDDDEDDTAEELEDKIPSRGHGIRWGSFLR